MVKDYQLSVAKVFTHRNPTLSSPQNWCVPKFGWIRINCDAHIGTGLQRGVEVVVRDCNGKVLFTGTRRFSTN